MTRRSIVLILLAILLAATAWMQTAAVPGEPLSQLLPGGALLVLEARDFSSLAAAWNASDVKQTWLASPNYAEFSRSKLFFRLQEAQDEFTSAAGLRPDWSFFQSIAGTETALALYDVGSLRFVYVTRLASARALETALWQSRAAFEPRQAGGQDYYVRSDAESGREASFAVVDDLLILSSASDLAAATLELLAGQDDRTVVRDGWYRTAVDDAGERGLLRLVYDAQGLVRTPHFRSYWIQRNASTIREFRAGVSDLERTTEGVRERRRMIRVEPSTADADPPAAAELARLAPPDAGLARAWATADPDAAVAVLRDKLLATPAPSYGYAYEHAPAVPTGASAAGSEAALETRIDQPPPPPIRPSFEGSPLRDRIADAGLRGVSVVESSDVQGDLIRRRTAVALLTASPLDAQSALAELRESHQDLWTAAGLGAEWRAADGLWSVDGLRSFHAFIAGSLLVVADSEPLLAQIQGRLSEPADSSSAGFRGVFRHVREADPFRSLMSHLDFVSGGDIPPAQRSPHLFSENIASLSDALADVAEVEVRRVQLEAAVEETLDYRTAE